MKYFKTHTYSASQPENTFFFVLHENESTDEEEKFETSIKRLDEIIMTIVSVLQSKSIYLYFVTVTINKKKDIMIETTSMVLLPH